MATSSEPPGTFQTKIVGSRKVRGTFNNKRERNSFSNKKCMLKREHFENGYLEIFSSQGVLITENYVSMSPMANSTWSKQSAQKVF